MKFYSDVNLPVATLVNPIKLTAPDLTVHGFEPSSTFLSTGAGLDTQAGVAAAVATLTGPNPIIVFDIEGGLDTRKSPQADVTARMNTLIQAAAWAKTANPNIRVGFYGLPFMDINVLSYYTIVQLRAEFSGWWTGMQPQIVQDFNAWQAACASLKPVYAVADVICPALYAPHNGSNSVYDLGDNDDIDYGIAWLPAAKWAIAKAKSYGKPVIPYLWPLSSELTYIPDAIWAKMVNFVVNSGVAGLIVHHDKSYRNETFSDNMGFLTPIREAAGKPPLPVWSNLE